MGAFIVILIIGGGIYIMSTVFRWLFSLTLISIIGYGLIHSDQFGDGFRHPESVENLVNLIYLAVGIFGLGSLLGVLRKLSLSPASYASHRNTVFSFLVLWGSLFMAWSFMGQKLLYAITGDHTLAFFMMKRFGGVSFVVILIVFLIIRYQLRKRKL